jgi:hypothetical protein
MTVTLTGTATRQPLAIAVDTNILVDAWSQESPRHQQAADLMDSLELGTSEWAIPDSCLYEYYQSVTSSKKFKNPATPKEGEFWTQDKGYGRFKGLTARDPLTGTVHVSKAATS